MTEARRPLPGLRTGPRTLTAGVFQPNQAVEEVIEAQLELLVRIPEDNQLQEVAAQLEACRERKGDKAAESQGYSVGEHLPAGGELMTGSSQTWAECSVTVWGAVQGTSQLCLLSWMSAWPCF